ncbi:hypothetical protein [Parasitella parasitica]|uniref:Uncharacterized protein n=1 Tax=Parasitella parasitica TaxID=35722 RepID=A0A0B7NWT9_9FUNG|nr:hypothetical protein [Parasitella parasitica]
MRNQQAFNLSINQENDVLNKEDPYLNKNDVKTDDQDNDQEEQEQFSELLSMGVFNSDMFQSSQSDNVLSEDDSIRLSSVGSSQNYQREPRQRSQQQKNLSEGEDGNMSGPFSSQSYHSNDDSAESENASQISSSSVSTASNAIYLRSSGSSRRSSTSGGSSNDITAAMARTTTRIRNEVSPSPERRKRQFDKAVSAEIPSGKRPRRRSLIDTNDTQRASTRVAAEASSSSAPLHTVTCCQMMTPF